MSESRALIFKNGIFGIRKCDMCQIGQHIYKSKHYCEWLLKTDSEPELYNFPYIPDACHLPFYDRVRWHDAKCELPESFLNVAVKMLKDGKVVYSTGLATRDGAWVADGIFIDGIVKIEILEWRYYE